MQRSRWSPPLLHVKCGGESRDLWVAASLLFRVINVGEALGLKVGGVVRMLGPGRAYPKGPGGKGAQRESGARLTRLRKATIAVRESRRTLRDVRVFEDGARTRQRCDAEQGE